MNDYPLHWEQLANVVKDAAYWRCIRCDRAHNPSAGYTLTAHHWDGDKANCHWWNLMALCQRCHLHIQAKVHPHDSWMFEHTDWCKPYAAGFYAWKYQGQQITRGEAMARMEELLALERMA